MKVEIVLENKYEAELLLKVQEAHRLGKKIVVINSKKLKFINNISALPHVVQSFTHKIGDRTNTGLCIG